MKRVCHVCSGHPADDARIFDRACVSLAEAGYEVHLIAKTSSKDAFISQGVHIIPAPVSSSRATRVLQRGSIAKLANSISPDLFHVHEPELLGAVLNYSEGKPVIWDVHEPFLEYISTKPWIPRPLRALVKRAWDLRERSLTSRCAAVVTATKWIEERYIPLHDRVCVIANFPKIKLPLPPVPLDRERNACVFTGTLAENRGLLNVIQAIARLKKQDLFVRMELAGRSINNEFLETMLSEIRRLDISDRVRYHGVLSKNDAFSLQEKCGIGLATSLPCAGSDFGYPVKMFEFMSLGIPVIYSNLPTFRSVGERYDFGICVDPQDVQQIAEAMKTLTLNAAIATQKGTEGQKAIQEFYNWDNEWIKLKQLYEQLL